MDLGDSAKEITAALVARGVAAVIDSADLNLPGAWVTPGAIALSYLDGTTADMEWDVYLVGPNTGTVEALNVLGAMLTAIAELGIAGATPVTLNLPNHSADPLPALLVTIQSTITSEA